MFTGVRRPEDPDKCWALVIDFDTMTPRQCKNPHGQIHLTCGTHRGHENEAKEFAGACLGPSGGVDRATTLLLRYLRTWRKK
jgi:hypothetical protein